MYLIPSWVLSSSTPVRVWLGDDGPAFPPIKVSLGKGATLLWEMQKTGLTFCLGAITAPSFLQKCSMRSRRESGIGGGHPSLVYSDHFAF